MNKVITINLGGTAFQLEDAGYEVLRAYLETAATRLRDNPDRTEILSDIEQALGEKFRTLLSAHKNVVLTSEVELVLGQMGPVEDPSAQAAASEGASAGATTEAPPEPATTASGGRTRGKRLYRVQDGAMIFGVCNGLAAYFDVDPTIVRLAFVALTLAWGSGLLVYVIMAIVVPVARTPEEKSEAHGVPPTAQDFIRRAKAGYYEAMRSFPNREARREWKRRFRQEMRDWRASFHRECADGAARWRRQWDARWTPNPGAGLALPFVSLLHGALVVIWLCALISLLATGALFGAVLPAGLPVWVAVLILMFVYGMIVWPLKAVRRAFYYGSYAPGPVWPFFLAFDLLVWAAVIGTLIWLAVHFFPQAHDAIQNIPGVVHEAVNNIRDWWRK